MTNRIALSIGLLGLCAAYLQSGIDKLVDFASAVAETERLGFAPAIPIAVATIFTQLTASALILSGFYRWFGALWLAGFTFIVTFVAFRFWNFPQPDRFNIENTFFEQLGLIGGFILVAFYDLKNRTSAYPRRRTRSRRFAISASLIGLLGSSAFRLSAAVVLMSLTGSCFSTESAHGPFHHGIRRRSGTIEVADLPSD